MSETFSLSELVIPGTYIRVRAEGLISAGGIPTGNIGIVGTAVRRLDANGNTILDPADTTGTKDTSIYGVTHLLSEYAAARNALGVYDAFSAKKMNLMRGIELLYLNGARTVFARALDPDATPAPGQSDYTTAFNELVKDNVNILVAPELSTADALAVLKPVLETGENNGKDMMAIIGSDAADVAGIKGQTPSDDRIIFCAPGIMAYDAAAGANVALGGAYAAAAVAGLVSTLTPEASPTNKLLSGVNKLAKRFSYGEAKELVSGRVLVLEERGGARVIRGLTTDDGAFKQITTRRITDFAKAGIRQVSNPFIGRLNNARVRKALQGAIDGFLTTMVQDEALIAYNLEVTATRPDEIAGRAIVNAILQPTFSIEFIAFTLILQ